MKLKEVDMNDLRIETILCIANDLGCDIEYSGLYSTYVDKVVKWIKKYQINKRKQRKEEKGASA